MDPQDQLVRLLKQLRARSIDIGAAQKIQERVTINRDWIRTALRRPR